MPWRTSGIRRARFQTRRSGGGVGSSARAHYPIESDARSPGSSSSSMTHTRGNGVVSVSSRRRHVLEAFFGGFQVLRAVQELAYGPVLAGKDVLIVSPTGSGKTEAAVAPLVDRYHDEIVSGAGPVVVYLSP